MEELLIEFINTLDLTLKKMQAQAGDRAGMAKLTIHQFQYLDAIHSLGTPTITEIAEQLKITKASVTAGVNKLADMGYLVKTRSSVDKRVFHVSLTEASQHLARAKDETVKEYGDFITSALSADEARQFQATLSKLVKLFKQA